MLKSEYEFIYGKLESPKDIEELSKKYSKEMLFNILARKIVRSTTKDFYIIKNKKSKLFARWMQGESFLQIANSINFPPVLTAKFILERMGLPKRQINLCINSPEKVQIKRIKKEMEEVVKQDFIYAPWANKMQLENGRRAEGKIREWLEGKGIKFLTEKQCKKNHKKTPDFLLEKEIEIEGKKINWIESKASFGDEKEIKKDCRKQLTPYVENFGPGLVVYWYGFIDGIVLDNVAIVSEDFLKNH